MTNNKYQISDEGIIYSLNEDGSVSKIGKIVDGKLFPIEDGSPNANVAFSPDADKPFMDMDAIFQLYGDIFGGKKVSGNPHAADYNQTKDACNLSKEEEIRIESKLGKLKSATINKEVFDNILLHLIDGFVWGKTSRKEMPNAICKDGTYYLYLNNTKSVFLYQNKNYKVFHSLSIEDVKEIPEQLKSALFFDECYSFNQWLYLIERIGLTININSREKRDYVSFFGQMAMDFVDRLGMLIFESELFSITFNLNSVDNDSPNVLKSIKITYKDSPEKSFWGKIF